MFSRIKKIFWGFLRSCPCEEDLFDFALDGLDGSSRAKVRRHLSQCPPCRDQVKDYAWVSEGIALTAPQIDPPDDLCDKVKARIRGHALERGLPASPPGMGGLHVGGWALFWMRLGPVFAILSLAMSFVALTAVTRQPGLTTSTASASPADAPILHQAVDLLNSPNLRRVSLSGTHPGAPCKGELIFAEGMDRLLVNVDNLKPCDHGRVYTVWMCQGKEKACRLAGFQTEDTRPSSYLLRLAKPLDTGGRPTTFRVTLEESGKDPSQLKGPEELSGRFEL